MRSAAFLLLLVSEACSRSPEVADLGTTPAAIPSEHATLSLDHFHLRVHRTGNLEWNGQEVSLATLTHYLDQLAHLPWSAGRLSVEFEPDTTAQLRAKISSTVVASGLCAARRCVQTRWNTPVPIVN